jgi:hypothetical protein
MLLLLKVGRTRACEPIACHLDVPVGFRCFFALCRNIQGSQARSIEPRRLTLDSAINAELSCHAKLQANRPNGCLSLLLDFRC